MSKKTIIIISIVISLIVGFVLYSIFKFKDTEIELNQSLTKEDFIAFGGSSLVDVDVNEVNNSVVGEYSVKIKFLVFTYNKKVSVVDRRPPVLEVQDIYRPLNYTINANDFIVSVTDDSDYSISFESQADTSKYGEYIVTIIAKDIYNNETKKEAKLMIGWVKKEYTVEVGTIIKASDLVYNAADVNTISQSELDVINSKKEGIYYLTSTKNGNKIEIKIEKTKDVTPPELVLKSVTIYEGKKLSDVNDFIVSVSDKGSEVTTKLITNINYNQLGEQKVQIEAVDMNGNKTTKETTLSIIKDTKGPEISGLTKITAKKRANIDYRNGVSAYDENTGSCTFMVDSSKVDILNYGTYYVTYTATDALGNKTTAKRVVEIVYDKNDISDLVRKTADSLPNNVEKIRDYVRNKISYDHNDWGGADPVWYGLTNKIGNCYVHAVVFEALLEAKGYTTKLIWTTDKTHYWNMLILNGKWVHMDSTPGPSHSKYSIMNDAKRYERLQGRDWDRSLWPKAE